MLGARGRPGRVKQRFVTLALHRLTRLAEQRGAGLVDANITAVDVLEPDRIGNRIDQRQQGAALTAGLGLGTLALGDLHRQAAVP